MVQCGHSVDDTKHHGCFQPVVHQVGIRQTSCKDTTTDTTIKRKVSMVAVIGKHQLGTSTKN